MTSSTDAAYLLTLTISELKLFKKAFQVLVRAGIAYDDAAIMLLQSHKSQSHRKANGY